MIINVIDAPAKDSPNDVSCRFWHPESRRVNSNKTKANSTRSITWSRKL
ncbi:hypothetical protein NC651_013753 [Populus alba x Populus x berolinensis]|nr:hypothetical protein NC651_013753 [Populus alba x Populus x berolinensis]